MILSWKARTRMNTMTFYEAHGQRKNPLDSFVGNYVYNVYKDEKNLNPEPLKVYVEDGDSIANWIYEYVKKYLPWITGKH